MILTDFQEEESERTFNLEWSHNYKVLRKQTGKEMSYFV